MENFYYTPSREKERERDLFLCEESLVFRLYGIPDSFVETIMAALHSEAKCRDTAGAIASECEAGRTLAHNLCSSISQRRYQREHGSTRCARGQHPR